jgi:hypothetical protein
MVQEHVAKKGLLYLGMGYLAIRRSDAKVTWHHVLLITKISLGSTPLPSGIFLYIEQ